MNLYKTYEELEKDLEKQSLNEFKGENALLIAGFIPGIGEFADLALILKWYQEKRYIEAGLMLFALIPTVGDIVVKPLIKIVGPAVRSGKAFAEFVAKTPKAAKLMEKLGQHLKNPKVINTINKAKSRKGPLGSILSKLHTYIIKLISDTKGLIATTAATGSIKTGSKMFFKYKALNKFYAKYGRTPKGLQKWWTVTYKAGRLRKNYITKLIVTNGVLNHLGIFNIRDLEEKIWKDPESLYNDPKFNEFADQVYKEGDESIGSEENSQSDFSSKLSGLSNDEMIGLFKKIASAI